MPPFCSGALGGAAVCCQYSRTLPGSPSRASRGQTRCSLCCPTLLEAALANPRKRGALKRLLAAFAASSLPVHASAVALVAAAGGDVDALTAAAVPPLPADPAAAWRAALGARKRVAAEPSAESLSEYAGRVADDRRRVARKFFKARLAPQPDGSEQMQADLAALVTDVGPNDSGLPSPAAGSTAALVEQWCRLGSWTICDQCHSLRKRPLKPVDLSKVAQPTTKKCAACASSAPSQRPARLHRQSKRVIVHHVHENNGYSRWTKNSRLGTKRVG